MNNELIEKSKELIMASSIGKYINEERINEALKNIYICNSKKELYDIYEEKTGKKYDGDLLGVNNAGISYFTKDSEPHAVIHEILHTLSSTFDKNGSRIKNGIYDKTKGKFTNDLNEGLTEYLTYKITGTYNNIYIQGKGLFNGIEESFNRFFQDENALLKIYFENDLQSLGTFINQTLSQKVLKQVIIGNDKGDIAKRKMQGLKDTNSFKYICDNIVFLDNNRIQKLTDTMNKETQKILKDRELEKKHPLLFKIKIKILGKNNNKLMLSESESFKEEKSIKEEIKALSKADEEYVIDKITNEPQKIIEDIEKNKEDIIP